MQQFSAMPELVCGVDNTYVLDAYIGHYHQRSLVVTYILSHIMNQMINNVALIPAAVALLLGSAVSAQVYYPNYSYSADLPTGQAGCTVLTSDLSYGSQIGR